MGTPKGRKAKKTIFNFTPRKLDMNIPQSQTVNSTAIYNKISVIKSDITDVKCDAIVNAANITLLSGGGIDGFIHNKAGIKLLDKCRDIKVKSYINGKEIRCFPGHCEVTDTIDTKLTNCKFVVHAVGPDCRENSDMKFNAGVLRSCYENCLEEMLNPAKPIKSMAFCCISTGIFSYPNEEAAKIPWETVVLWL